MSEDATAEDVDAEDLQRQLDEIKGAMGLAERYPGQRRMWLVYGVVVGGVAILTNVAFAFPLPNLAYVLAWFGMVAVVAVAQWRLVSGTAGDRPTTGPNWLAVVGALALALLALWTALGDLVGTNTAGVVQGAHYFSHVLVFFGLGFLLTGTLLRTEQVRRRDRLPFYVGGVWMLVLGAFVPHVEALQYWGYGAFGALFLVHSLASYALTGTD